MTDEEFVQAHWKNTFGIDGLTGCFEYHGRNNAEWYAAAAEFTHERLEEIRQLREEIEMVRDEFGSARSHIIVDLEADWTVECFRWARILTRLESALADLRKGMK